MGRDEWLSNLWFCAAGYLFARIVNVGYIVPGPGPYGGLGVGIAEQRVCGGGCAQRVRRSARGVRANLLPDVGEAPPLVCAICGIGPLSLSPQM